MTEWTYTKVDGGYGLFMIYVSDSSHGWTDVTFVRGVPTQLNALTYADPFSDATASFTLPGIAGIDGYRRYEDLWWLRPWTLVDVYYYEASKTPRSGSDPLIYNPDTLKKDLYLHTTYGTGGTVRPIWQGHILNLDPGDDGTQVTCQGALYQLDSYQSLPYYPRRPQSVENLIARQFNNTKRPGLYTAPLVIDWPGWLDPAGSAADPLVTLDNQWVRRFTQSEADNVDYLTPENVSVGQFYTGFSNRNTGQFDAALTGYIQALLGTMFTAKDSYNAGLENAGKQWTILMNQRGNPSAPPFASRTPVLQVRDPDREPDVYVWYGQPGVSGRFSQDGSSTSNIVFGQGVGIDGIQWKRMNIIGIDAEETEFVPLAYGVGIWPYSEANKQSLLNPREKYFSFPQGIGQAEAYSVARQWILRDADPGYSGSLTLEVDPLTMADANFSRWMLRPGMTILVRGFAGTFRNPIRLYNKFHIAEVTLNPQEGTVDLRLDTKYRDLLTLEEAQAALRDPLTPIKALRVNQRSALIDDIGYQWNYAQGSGFIPQYSLNFYSTLPPTALFPYQDFTTLQQWRPDSGEWKKQIPDGGGTAVDDPEGDASDLFYYSRNFYVAVRAGSSSINSRWSGGVPVVTAQKGTIRRTQLAAYHFDGSVCTHCEFHFSIYYANIGVEQMPKDSSGNYDPFAPNAFQTINPATGEVFPGESDASDSYTMPATQNLFIVGWGSGDEPAGYSPYTAQSGAHPSGRLEDEGTWTFNNVTDAGDKLDPNALSWENANQNAVTLFAMIYARINEGVMARTEHNQTYGQHIYFTGRLYKSIAGADPA